MTLGINIDNPIKKTTSATIQYVFQTMNDQMVVMVNTLDVGEMGRCGDLR